MPTAAGELGMQAAQGAVGGVLGLALGGINDKRQLKQQKKLQALQIAGNKEMTDYQMQKELAMWKATNYSAQRDELEKAGLNAALLYGMSGGGGTTTGGSGGGVSGAAAPQGGGEILAGTGMGIQMGMMQAQKGLIEAQTKNVEADTAKKSGVDTKEAETRIQDLTQGIQNKKAAQILTETQTETAKLANEITGRSKEDVLESIMRQAEKARMEVDIMERYNILDEKTQDEKLKIIEEEATAAGLKNTLLRKGINLADAQIKQLAQDLILKYQEFRLKEQGNQRGWTDQYLKEAENMIKQQANINVEPDFIKPLLDMVQTIVLLRMEKGGKGPGKQNNEQKSSEQRGKEFLDRWKKDTYSGYKQYYEQNYY